MLNLNVTFYWFHKYETGEKTDDFREITPYWTKRLKNIADRSFWNYEKNRYDIFIKNDVAVYIRKGYSNKKLIGWCYRIDVVDGMKTDLHVPREVYAIRMRNIHVASKWE